MLFRSHLSGKVRLLPDELFVETYGPLGQSSPVPGKPLSTQHDVRLSANEPDPLVAQEPNGKEVGKEVKLQPGSPGERRWRAFCQMFRKRALIASRDLRGGFSTLLLPVVAIALVLLILKININPTAPTMVLSLSALPQVGKAPPLSI